ncbi:unnamed protein product [Dicrocoelium dendriticum]|nr:unnamed protein product [Dicrocoelium dendriticum]
MYTPRHLYTRLTPFTPKPINPPPSPPSPTTYPLSFTSYDTTFILKQDSPPHQSYPPIYQKPPIYPLSISVHPPPPIKPLSTPLTPF